MAAPRTDAPGLFSAAVLRRALWIFVPAALLTGGVALTLYRLDRDNERALHEQAGAHLVALQSEVIARELKTVESDLLFLANHKTLRDFVSRDPSEERDFDPAVERNKQLLEIEYVLFCRQKGVYDQIRYLDDKGLERVRVNYNDGAPAAVPDSDLQPKGDRYYFRQTMLLPRDGIFVSRFDLNEERGEIERPIKPVIRVATPVFDQDRRTRRGIVILNYLGTALIDKLREAAGTFSGSAWLVNRDGYFLHGPSPDDEWGFVLGHSRTLASYYPDEWQRIAESWQRIAESNEGQFHTPAGLFTYRLLETGPLQQVADPAYYLDPDAADPGMIVVANVPPAVLDARATALLRKLLLLSGVVLVLVLGLAWYLGYAGALRRGHERRLAESESRLRALSAQLMTAQEEERRSIARDLHDEMGQVVTAMTLDLQRAAQATERDKKDDLIARALRGAGRLLESIHEVAARIRPSLLDDLGLKDAVQSYLGDYEHRTGIAVHADLLFDRADVPSGVAENVYRILQEALTNVAKHARAKEVNVALRVTAGRTVLTVRDDGTGFVPATVDGQRLGLLGMRERAELLEGTFTVKSEPGRGTEVQVALPIPARKE
jgi:signal transduction histidine kinase